MTHWPKMKRYMHKAIQFSTVCTVSKMNACMHASINHSHTTQVSINRGLAKLWCVFAIKNHATVKSNDRYHTVKWRKTCVEKMWGNFLMKCVWYAIVYWKMVRTWMYLLFLKKIKGRQNLNSIQKEEKKRLNGIKMEVRL